jgi:putative exporter of polyketide antibiotics
LLCGYAQGFPRADLDITAVRADRQRLSGTISEQRLFLVLQFIVASFLCACFFCILLIGLIQETLGSRSHEQVEKPKGKS